MSISQNPAPVSAPADPVLTSWRTATTGSLISEAAIVSSRAPLTNAMPPTIRSPVAMPNVEAMTPPTADGDHSADQFPTSSVATCAMNSMSAPATTASPARRTQNSTYRTSRRRPRIAVAANTRPPMPTRVPRRVMKRPAAPTRPGAADTSSPASRNSSSASTCSTGAAAGGTLSLSTDAASCSVPADGSSSCGATDAAASWSSGPLAESVVSGAASTARGSSKGGTGVAGVEKLNAPSMG